MFWFKYESMEVLFDLTKNILLFIYLFICNSNKIVSQRYQKNGIAN